MKSLYISILFCVVLSYETLAASENCDWSECMTSNNNSLTPDDIDCPDGKDVVSIQTCSTTSVTDGGFMAYCCSENSSNVQKGSILTKSYGSTVHFMWWPNDKGILVRVAMFCPFPISLATNESVKFFLYTRNNTNMMDFEELIVDDVNSLENSSFNKSAPVKIVIHGFMSNGNQGPAKVMRQSYIKLSYPVNIIAVDWRKLANYAEGFSVLNPFNYLCYGAAAEATTFVGKRSALMLEFLIKQNYTQLENIHIMGHSLGAHASGHTGKSFSMGKFRRITGFDPAGPNFRNVDGDKRIDYSDAEFVDVIHTSTTGGDFSVGLREQVGHADFYPNSGTYQPGCPMFPPFLFPPYPPSPACSHGRSYELYGDGVKPPSNKVFRGILCKSIEEAENGNCEGPENILMGACTSINNSSRNIYYLKTEAESPFALDEEKVSDPDICPLN